MHVICLRCRVIIFMSSIIFSLERVSQCKAYEYLFKIVASLWILKFFLISFIMFLKSFHSLIQKIFLPNHERFFLDLY